MKTQKMLVFAIRFAAGWYLGAELAKMVERTEMAELTARVALLRSERLMKENDKLTRLVEEGRAG